MLINRTLYLEVLSVGFVMFCSLVLPIITSLATLYLLIAGNIYWKAICALYLAFTYYDRHAGDRGGRGAGVPWVKALNMWKHCINYFPLDLVKTVDLPADRNYLFCVFPHGIFSIGAFVTFNRSHSKWSKFFPAIRSKCATLALYFLFPLTREILLNFGMCSASANSLTRLLQQSNDPNDESNQDGYTSNGVGLIVGGIQEAFYAVPDTYKCVLKNRKGFVRIALKTGAPLVPAISFGENNLFKVMEFKTGSLRRNMKDVFKWISTTTSIFFNGLFIPKRQPITIVVGAPIQVDKQSNPSEDDVNKTHELFCMQLKQLFDTHKSKYVKNSDKVQLEFI